LTEVVPGKIQDDKILINSIHAKSQTTFKACPQSQLEIKKYFLLNGPDRWNYHAPNIDGRNCAGWVSQVLTGAGFSLPAPNTPYLRPESLK
jgi:hypothetical protein